MPINGRGEARLDLGHKLLGPPRLAQSPSHDGGVLTPPTALRRLHNRRGDPGQLLVLRLVQVGVGEDEVGAKAGDHLVVQHSVGPRNLLGVGAGERLLGPGPGLLPEGSDEVPHANRRHPEGEGVVAVVEPGAHEDEETRMTMLLQRLGPVVPPIHGDATRRQFIVGGIAAGLLVVAGCGSDDDVDSASPSTTAAGGAFPATIEHKYGSM